MVLERVVGGAIVIAAETVWTTEGLPRGKQTPTLRQDSCGRKFAHTAAAAAGLYVTLFVGERNRPYVRGTSYRRFSDSDIGRVSQHTCQ